MSGLACATGGPLDGRPVLLLHPWFCSDAVWDPILPVLEGNRLFRFDLYSPAVGDWRPMAAPEPLAAAVVDVLDREIRGPVTVIGNSMGGVLAQMVAAARPGRVDRLVLVGTGAQSSGLHSEFGDRLRAWISDPDPALLSWFTRSVVVPAAANHPSIVASLIRLAAVDPRYVAAVPAATLGLDLRPRLRRIRARTMIVRGEHDAIRTRHHAEELAALISGARHVEIAGAGHSPMVDATFAFNPLLADFLA